MDANDILLDVYSRIPPLVREAVSGLDAVQLATPPAPGVNTIGWLAWHLIRVQDSHIAELIEAEQEWVTGDWPRRFGLTPDPSDTGWGHGPDDVAGVRPERADAVTGYLDAVDQRTRRFLEGLEPADLDRVVDRRWDPPVTMGVRLVSIADDCIQHAGQAAYARGLLGF